MTTTTITSRTDLLTHLADVRSDLDTAQREAVADQIQHSDHPAWGADWEEWLGEELPGLVTATVDGLKAMEETAVEEGYFADRHPLNGPYAHPCFKLDGVWSYVTDDLKTLPVRGEVFATVGDAGEAARKQFAR